MSGSWNGFGGMNMTRRPIWREDMAALSVAIEIISGKKVLQMMKYVLISGALVLAAIVVTIFYACMVVAGNCRKQ